MSTLSNPKSYFYKNINNMFIYNIGLVFAPNIIFLIILWFYIFAIMSFIYMISNEYMYYASSVFITMGIIITYGYIVVRKNFLKYKKGDIYLIMPDIWYEDIYSLDKKYNNFKEAVRSRVLNNGFITLEDAIDITNKYLDKNYIDKEIIDINKEKKELFFGVGKFLK